MKTYIIMGLGAIGSNLLMELINIDPKAEFIGIDFDKVEDRNINTQAYFLHHIGMYKAQAMQIVIGMKKNGIKYFPIVKKINNIYKDINLFGANQVIGSRKDILIIDCFDNAESRKLLEGIDNCLHIGFSPQYTAEIIWGKNYNTPNNIPKDQDDICEMSYASSFIKYIVGFAGIVIKEYLETGNRNNYAILDKYKIRKL